MKIARVLDETDRENKAINLGKRKFEYDNQGPKDGNAKGLTRVDPKIRESNWFLSRIDLPATFTVDSALASTNLTRCDVINVVKQDIK